MHQACISGLKGRFCQPRPKAWVDGGRRSAALKGRFSIVRGSHRTAPSGRIVFRCLHTQAVGLGFHITHLWCLSELSTIIKGMNMLYSYLRTGAIAFALIAASTTVSSLSTTAIISAQNYQSSFKFDFGPGQVASGYTQVLPAMTYTKERGYGFEPGATITGVERNSKDALRGDFCTSDKPFFFSVALPEGNYNATVTLGDAAGVLQVQLALGCEAHAPCRAIDEGHAHPRLHQRQMLADRGCRDAQLPCGGAQAARAREHRKEPQVSRLNAARHVCSIRD